MLITTNRVAIKKQRPELAPAFSRPICMRFIWRFRIAAISRRTSASIQLDKANMEILRGGGHRLGGEVLIYGVEEVLAGVLAFVQPTFCLWAVLVEDGHIHGVGGGVR